MGSNFEKKRSPQNLVTLVLKGKTLNPKPKRKCWAKMLVLKG
jgi:hypothetical protein